MVTSKTSLEAILNYRVKLLGTLATAGLATLFAGGVGIAHADAGIGLHEVANPQGAVVHDAPAGLYIGHLAQGDKFDTTDHDARGVWCKGHAYGNVHQDGWVLCEDLTPSHW
jgi:hypothetical protein